MRKQFRFILFAVISALLSFNIYAYNIPEGYLVSPLKSSFGIIATNEYESAIYLITDDGFETLVSAPGCGRYMMLSPDGNKIGFKLIDESTTLQTPAYLDLSSKSIVKLESPVKKCGQVVFDASGNIYYTIGEKLIRVSSSGKNEFNLGTVSNLTPVSPDGKFAIVKDGDDQLWKFDLDDQSKVLLTDSENGYYNASWSYNGQYIACQTIDAKVLVIDIDSGESFEAGDGENPKWSANSNEIVYFRKDVDFEMHDLLSSEIYKFSPEAGIEQITETPGEFEMNPSFTGEGNIIFDTYDQRQIKLLDRSERLMESRTAFTLNQKLNTVKANSLKKTNPVNKPADLDNWVHIHQVFDTRDSGPWTSNPVTGKHQGYACCGAATCMEILASYRILPPDPINTYSHTSEYGKYISDEYEYDGHVYSGFTTSGDRPGNATGAHGYMWNAGGSPHSNSAAFLKNHGVDAVLSDQITWSKVKAEIDAGYSYLLCSISLTDGHIVLGIGQYGDGQTLYCNDPYGDKNAGSYGGIRNGKNAVYDWGDENTGHMKITPVVWGVTAHYDRTLPLVSSYPEDGQSNVSPSTRIILDFNNPLTESSLEDYILLLDQNNSAVDVAYDYSMIDDGKLILDPVGGLSGNAVYKIYIDYRTSSVNGLQYEKNSILEFETGQDRPVSGEALENFEGSSQFSFITFNVVEETTSIDMISDKAYEGNLSAQLTYEFSSTSGTGYCRMLYDPELSVGPATGKYVGMWVYGDCSYNNLEVWFSKPDGNIAAPLKITLSWSGWKYIDAELAPLFGDDSISLNSIAVRQNKDRELSGLVKLDYVSIQDLLPQVTAFSPSDSDPVELDEGFEMEFNKPMNKTETENAININPSVEGAFSWNSDESVSFIPSGSLQPNTDYNVTLGMAAEDTDGNSLGESYEFTFKTVRTGLSLEQSYPTSGMTEVSRNVKVILDFDEYINQNTLFGNVQFLDSDDNEIDIVVDGSEYSAGKIMFEPAQPLELNSVYKLLVKTGVADTKGLHVPSDFEISFRTVVKDYVSGNVLENFETVDNWIQPTATGNSIGIHSFNTELSKYSGRKVSGDYSAKLEYKFTGVQGLCNLMLNNAMAINSSASVGVWVSGDYSFNDFEFVFAKSNEETYTTAPLNIDWTGWRLVQVDMSELAEENIESLLGINIVQTDSGTVSNKLLFDDLQTDIVLPVEETEILPTEYSLKQNYPNPFNPATIIEYELPVAGTGRDLSQRSVKLVVYDILGRKVATLVNKQQKPGTYKVNFDGTNLSTGIYFYRLDAGDFSSVRKMLLIK